MIKTSRILSIILTLIIASASWTGAKAAKEGEHANVNGIHFIINGFGTATVTNTQYLGEGYGYYTNTVQIPSTINVEGETYTVTGIQEKAFYRCPNLKSVQIPSTVSTIGAQAFDESNVLKITVDPTSAYFYADLNGVLYNKTQTELIFCPKTISGSFIVPEDVKTIKKFAFNGCCEITNIVMPNSLKQIEDGAFWDCSKLASANIPSSLTLLGSDAFRDAASLSSNIVLPSTLSEVGSNAFRGCKKLTHVTIKYGVSIIGNHAFEGCLSLTSIVLPTTITAIGTSAFENAGLKSIDIPQGITEINASTFSGCKLTKITLPAGLETIGAQAFYNNGTTIEKVEIPESVTSIGFNAFNNTSVMNFYINNIPSSIVIDANSFKKSSTTIHVFTKMKSIFEQTPNWGNYGGHFVEDIEITHVETIELDIASMIVLATKTGKLNATINPDDARIKEVIFTSSDNGVITIVDPRAGTFIAGADEGSATITCSAADGSGKFAQCNITVRKDFIPVTSVTLTVTNAIMEVGNSIPVEATVTPSDATYNNIIWISSDENVAKVENGNIIAVGPGNATLTAISGDGAARAKCKVSVSYETFEMEDGNEYDRKEDTAAKHVVYSRIFKSTNWQGLYLPFDISYEHWKDNFDVAIVNNIHQFDNDDDGTIDETLIEVVKQKDGKTIKAHTPCVIRAKQTSEDAQSIVVNNVIIRKAEYKSIDCASVSTKYVFYGTYRPIDGDELVAGNHYVLTSNGIREGQAGDILPANRWYLDIIDRESESISAARISIACFDDDEMTQETAGIETVGNDSAEIIAIFDTNGRKQNGLTKGINIVKYANGSTKKITK